MKCAICGKTIQSEEPFIIYHSIPKDEDVHCCEECEACLKCMQTATKAKELKEAINKLYGYAYELRLGETKDFLMDVIEANASQVEELEQSSSAQSEKSAKRQPVPRDYFAKKDDHDDGSVLFSNVGETLQSVAKVSCWLGFICFAIIAIVLWNANSPIGLNFGVLIGGCLISWLGSLAWYAFGVLVQNSCVIVHWINEEKANKKSK